MRRVDVTDQELIKGKVSDSGGTDRVGEAWKTFLPQQNRSQGERCRNYLLSRVRCDSGGRRRPLDWPRSSHPQTPGTAQPALIGGQRPVC